MTRLLQAWGAGDEAALAKLIPLVLQATGLVNEAFLRLVDAQQINWQNRSHFFAMSARLMRRVLVDMARARQSGKRGGALVRMSLDEALLVAPGREASLVGLDDALQGLAAMDERKSRVVELRFFGGLGVEETAAVLDVSAKTVMRDWDFAKAWLQREMAGDGKHDV